MKKYLALFLAFSMIFSSVAAIAEIDVNIDLFDDRTVAESVYTSTWDGVTISNEWLNSGNPEAVTGEEFYLNSAADLAGFAHYVNTYASTNNIFSGDTVYLNVDVDLANFDWNPIGTGLPREKNRFYGSFNGQGHTISNLKVADGHYYAGLFGQIPTYTYTQTFSNVTINNANVVAANEAKSKEAAGALIGRANGSVIDNCHVTGEVYISGDRFVGGLLGHSYVKMSDCSVNASGTINADTWQAGGLIGSHGATTAYTSSVSNCSVAGDAAGLAITSYYASVGGAIGSVSVSGVDSTPIDNISVSNVSISAENPTNGTIAGVASGYTATNSTSNNLNITVNNETVAPADSVAMIGDTNYTTINDVLNAVKTSTGNEITLLADVSVSNQNALDAFTGDIVNLNGYTLTTAGNSYFGNGTTTFTNGNIVVAGNVSDSHFCAYATNAVIVFDDVVVTGDNYSTGCAIFNANYGKIEIVDSEIKVSGDTVGGLIYGGAATIENTTIDAKNVCRGITNSVAEIKENSTFAFDGGERGFNNSTVTVDASEVVIKNATKSAVRLGDNTLTLTNNASLAAENCAEDVVLYSPSSKALVVRDTTSELKADFEDAVATIGGTTYISLDDAVKAATNGDVITITKAGTYTQPIFTGKSVTFEATTDGVVFNYPEGSKIALGGADVNFNNITFNWSNAGHNGFQHSGDLTYTNCVINGQPFLYGESETFTNCTFNQEIEGNYNVWTYSAKEVEFNGCTFNSTGRSVLVYNDGGNATNLNVANTTFNASQPAEGKAAIEIDPSFMSGNVAIVVDGATTANGFAEGNKSGNSLWNVKNAPKAGTGTTVLVDDVVVYAQVGADKAAATIESTSYATLQDAVDAAVVGSTITLTKDIEEDIVFSAAVSTFSLANTGVTFDLNGYTLTGDITIEAGATVVVKNGTIIGTLTNNGALSIVSGNFSFDPSAYVIAGKKAIVDTYGWYTIVDAATKDNSIAVVFEEVNTVEGEALYNINVVNADGINRLNSADLTFEFIPDAVDGGAMVYEILEKEGSKISVSQHPENANRYLFNYDTKEGVVDTDDSITIGQVKVTGYGSYDFSIVGATNEVHATTVTDNIVDTYDTTGAADKGVLDTSAKLDDIVIAVPTRELTIQIAFPNALELDNVKAYQDMKVTIEGNFEGIEETRTYNLGSDEVFMTNGGYVVTEDELVLNNAYNVTVSGAGYRTARYTVTMTEAKTLNFWNNVKSTPEVIEVGKTTGAVEVTFLAGDIVKDNSINIYDLSAVVSYFGTNNDTSAYSKYAKYDLNRDGKIDSKDVAYVLVSWEK